MDARIISFKALDIFRDHFYIFLDAILNSIHGENWRVLASQNARQRVPNESDSIDLPHLISLFYTDYFEIRKHLPPSFPKNILKSIKAYRNQIMHQQVLSYTDVYDLLNQISLVMEMIQAIDLELNSLKSDILKLLNGQELEPSIQPIYAYSSGNNQIPAYSLRNNQYAALHQFYVMVPMLQYKPHTLLQILDSIKNTKSIIYCNKGLELRILRELLQGRGLQILHVDENMDQSHREFILRDFGANSNVVLLSAGQLISSINISYIINYEFPHSFPVYAQRLQNIQNLTTEPVVINLIVQDEFYIIQEFEFKYNVGIREYPVHLN